MKTSKMAPMKSAAMPKAKASPMGDGGGSKPHLRMRKLKPGGGASAFPTAPVAFPQAPGAIGAGSPGMAMSGPMPGAAGAGAAGGDMGQ